MNIGERIRKKRKKAGLTLEELSKKIGVSKQTVQRYESGEIKHIPSDKIELMAIEFGVSPGYIMGWEEEKPSYYTDPEVASIAQELYDNPSRRALFDASRNLSKEDMEYIINLMERLEKK